MSDGTVKVFNPATSHVVDGSEKRRYVDVLHQGPVDSPEAAVRAAIVGGAQG